MKKVLFLFTVIVFVSCKSDKKSEDINTSSEDSEKIEEQNDGLTLLKGEFIYYADAAVLQTTQEVYAVVINKKMEELNELVQQYKNEITDMVPVEIKGKISPKPENEEGWPFRVEIVEILNVSKPNPEGGEIITIGKD
jgi:hypothetical protein